MGRIVVVMWETSNLFSWLSFCQVHWGPMTDHTVPIEIAVWFQMLFQLEYLFNGNSRILTWRYMEVLYLHFRILKFPLWICLAQETEYHIISFHICPSPNHNMFQPSLHRSKWQRYLVIPDFQPPVGTSKLEVRRSKSPHPWSSEANPDGRWSIPRLGALFQGTCCACCGVLSWMDSRYRLYINASDYQLATNISYVPLRSNIHFILWGWARHRFNLRFGAMLRCCSWGWRSQDWAASWNIAGSKTTGAAPEWPNLASWQPGKFLGERPVMNISRGRWAMQNWQVLSMVGVRSCWAIPMPYMQIYI